MMLDGGFEKDSIQMNVSTLKMTSIYQKYGPKIFIMNLILICIKEGRLSFETIFIFFNNK